MHQVVVEAVLIFQGSTLATNGLMDNSDLIVLNLESTNIVTTLVKKNTMKVLLMIIVVYAVGAA